MLRLTLALLISLLASNPAPAFSQPANVYTFPGPDVDLGQSYIGRVVSGGHYIGGRGDTIYVLREFDHTYCHKSTDGGQTFSPGVRVNSTPSGAVNASLQVDTAGVVYVAYQGFLEADIFFTKSTDGGQAFLTAVKVNDDMIPQTGQEKPTLCVNNKGQIFAAWRDQRNSDPQTHQTVFAAASYDGGGTFTSNVQVNDTSIDLGGSIDIAADNAGHVYMVWMPNRRGILLSRSDDSCQTFSVRAEVADVPIDSTIAGSGFQSISIGDGVVGVIWQDLRYDQFSLRFSSSLDYGDSFSPSVVIDSSDHPQLPSLAWKNEIFYSAWRATHSSMPSGPDLDHIWFSYSRDSGQSFAPYNDAVPDNMSSIPRFIPTIWVNKNEKAFVAWTDTRWDPLFDEDHHLFVSVGTPLPSKGDLNFDGMINMVDIVLELNAVFSGELFPAPQHRADGNCDGQLTPADMVILLNRWYGDIPFPC